MHSIPFQRYAGRRIAFGVYGMPTIPLPALSRRTAIVLALFGVLLALAWLGILPGGHALAGGLFLAGPTTTTSAARQLHDEREAFKKWYADNLDADSGRLKGGLIDEFHKRNDALTELVAQADAEAKMLANDDAIAKGLAPQRRLVGPEQLGLEVGDPRQPLKSLGELFVESAAFKNRPKGRAQGPEFELDVDQMYGKGRGFKTLFDTGTGFAVQNIRLPEAITPGAQQPTIASLMPEGRTSGNAIVYMEETTTTSNAAETAESGTKPEAALAFTERTSNVRKIAVSLPVTDESLDDVPFIESYIDGRLSFFIQQREDSELLVGDATGVNLRGLLNVSGINTQATGSDNNQDAILKAIVKVQVNSFFDADAVVLHPNNWQTMRLSKDDIGNYLFGPPNMLGGDTVFGYRIVRTTAMTANTGLAGAFRACAQVFRRSDLTLQVGFVNDQFIKNQRTILVEERLALVPFRPAGFTKITGLA